MLKAGDLIQWLNRVHRHTVFVVGRLASKASSLRLANLGDFNRFTAGHVKHRTEQRETWPEVEYTAL